MKSLFRVPIRVHNGLLIMTYLAANFEKAPVSLEEIAKREGISQGYLEEIANDLRKANLIEGRRGQNGGYVLTQQPQTTDIAAVIDALEGPVNLVDCLAPDATCPSDNGCSNRKIWKTVQDNIADTLKSISLQDLVAKKYQLEPDQA